MISDILVKNVDVELLRKQRNFLLGINSGVESSEVLDGVINLLDNMLDTAEAGDI